MSGPPVEAFADTTALREQVIRACLRLADLGFVIGTWGNIGVRVTDGVLVTPTRLDWADMQPEDLVVVSWSGERIRGHRLPTSEMHLHRLLLLHRPDLGAIIHCHSPWASAVACTGQTLPVVAEDMAQAIGGEVRCSEYARGGTHLTLAEAAVAAMDGEAAAVLLANHGVVVGGRDLDDALVAAQVLEKAALIFLHASPSGRCRVIPPEAVRAERDRYLHKYGTGQDVESPEDCGG